MIAADTVHCPRQQYASPSHSHAPPAAPLAIDDETLREGIEP